MSKPQCWVCRESDGTLIPLKYIQIPGHGYSIQLPQRELRCIKHAYYVYCSYCQCLFNGQRGTTSIQHGYPSILCHTHKTAQRCAKCRKWTPQRDCERTDRMCSGHDESHNQLLHPIAGIMPEHVRQVELKARHPTEMSLGLALRRIIAARCYQRFKELEDMRRREMDDLRRRGFTSRTRTIDMVQFDELDDTPVWDSSSDLAKLESATSDFITFPQLGEEVDYETDSEANTRTKSYRARRSAMLDIKHASPHSKTCVDETDILGSSKFVDEFDDILDEIAAVNQSLAFGSDFLSEPMDAPALGPVGPME